MTRLLAVDAATRSTGIAVMEWWKHFEVPHIGHTSKIRITDKKMHYVDRCIKMAEEVYNLCELMEPEYVLIELPVMQGSVGRMTGTHSMLTACSIAIFTLCKEQFKCLMVPVNVWKGSIPKQVIYNRLEERHGKSNLPRAKTAEPWNDDRIDAIGICTWFFDQYRSSDGRIYLPNVATVLGEKS